jgi:predicted transcriptional regulator
MTELELKYGLIKYKITQRDLCVATGISEPKMSSILRGYDCPEAKEWKRIVKVYEEMVDETNSR